jgi:hypothetical protein
MVLGPTPYLPEPKRRIRVSGVCGTCVAGRKKHPRHEERRLAFTGKISGLIFDRFGDFEGFLLDTEDGEREYCSREREVKDSAERAWRERLQITVWAECGEPHRPLSIIVRQPPAPF